MTARRVLRVVLAVVLSASVAWAVIHFRHLHPADIDARVHALGGWAPVVFTAAYAVGTVLFLPGSLFSLAGGAVFGPVWGSVLNLMGATAGATLSFLVARYLARDWVRMRAGGRANRIIAGVEAEGWRFVALTRLVPLVPFNLLNYVLGLTRIHLDRYVLASAICMAPGAVAYTWLGYAGRRLASGDRAALTTVLIALGLFAAVLLLPRLIRRLRADSPGTAA